MGDTAAIAVQSMVRDRAGALGRGAQHAVGSRDVGPSALDRTGHMREICGDARGPIRRDTQRSTLPAPASAYALATAGEYALLALPVSGVSSVLRPTAAYAAAVLHAPAREEARGRRTRALAALRLESAEVRTP